MAARNSTGWILSVAARSKCPRCGQGHLFNGFLTFAKSATCAVWTTRLRTPPMARLSLP